MSFLPTDYESPRPGSAARDRSRLAVLVVLAGVVLLALALREGIGWFSAPAGTRVDASSSAPDNSAGSHATDPTGDRVAGEIAVVAAFRERRSGLVVEVEGTVERELEDDLRGSRHQRFVLRLFGGHTLLIAHNIDLAPRVPVASGDAVAVRGEYEWSERGGVLHWTHHDPGGQRAGGWIRHGGREYR